MQKDKNVVNIKNFNRLIKAAKRTKKGSVYTAFLKFLNHDFSIIHKTYTLKGKESFYSNMTTLLVAGLDLLSSIETIISLNNNPKEKSVLAKIKVSLESGKDLSKAFEATGQFSPYEYYSIKVGECSGNLVKVLSELQIHFANKIKQRRLLISALSYPLIVVLTSFGALLFMLKFIVPMYSEIFKRFDSDLPRLTQLILELSHVTTRYFNTFILFLIIASLSLYAQRKKNWFSKLKNKVLLALPIYGKILEKIYLSRLCQSMCLLLRSGTILVESIDLSKRMVGSHKMEIALSDIKKSIISGKSLHLSMIETKVFDTKFISLIKVGEQSNQLDSIFEKLGNNYMDEVEYHTKLFGNYIEPILILFLGVIVGLILVSMYLPLFKLGSTIR